MQSPQYKLNKEDLTSILKVVLWSGLSAMVGTLITVVNQLDVPAEYLFIVPIVNTVLVAVHKLLKR